MAKARPGRVVGMRGVVFQYDRRDVISDWLIHPFEQLDRRLAGIKPRLREPAPLAIHVGAHVEVADQSGEAPEVREWVVEQLFGKQLRQIVRNVLRNGLTWTPLAEFEQRDHGGWHVSIPATTFRFVDEAAVEETLARLNRIEGHPFMAEDCVRFVERAFGERRLFADSPTLRLLGLHVGVADPALPLLRADAALDPHAARLLRWDALRHLPNARGRAARVSAARRVALGSLALVLLLLGLGYAVARSK